MTYVYEFCGDECGRMWEFSMLTCARFKGILSEVMYRVVREGVPYRLVIGNNKVDVDFAGNGEVCAVLNGSVIRTSTAERILA